MRTHLALTVTVSALALAAPAVASAAAGTIVLRAPVGALRVVDGRSGALVRTLPAGALSADRSTVLTTRVHDGTTLVRRIAVGSGTVLARREIPGTWGIQRASTDGTLVAGGDDGAAVALVAADRVDGYRGSAPVTRIAVLDASRALRTLRLRGNFGVDALGPNHQYLYLIQHLAGERYQVRAYDLQTRQLDPRVVVDKTEPNERMAGLPLARATSRGDWVLTLYRRPNGVPFVHALQADSLAASASTSRLPRASCPIRRPGASPSRRPSRSRTPRPAGWHRRALRVEADAHVSLGEQAARAGHEPARREPGRHAAVPRPATGSRLARRYDAHPGSAARARRVPLARDRDGGNRAVRPGARLGAGPRSADRRTRGGALVDRALDARRHPRRLIACIG